MVIWWENADSVHLKFLFFATIQHFATFYIQRVDGNLYRSVRVPQGKKNLSAIMLHFKQEIFMPHYFIQSLKLAKHVPGMAVIAHERYKLCLSSDKAKLSWTQSVGPILYDEINHHSWTAWSSWNSLTKKNIHLLKKGLPSSWARIWHILMIQVWKMSIISNKNMWNGLSWV